MPDEPESLKDYEVDENDRIISPGKFEGQCRYAPYFYDMGMNGMADDTQHDDEGGVFVFYISPDDLDIFPELKDTEQVRIHTSPDGFVKCEAIVIPE